MREFLNPAAVLFLASVLWGSAWIPLNAIESAGISHSLLLLIQACSIDFNLDLGLISLELVSQFECHR